MGDSDQPDDGAVVALHGGCSSVRALENVDTGSTAALAMGRYRGRVRWDVGTVWGRGYRESASDTVVSDWTHAWWFWRS